jgi:hypothetical protein
VISNEGRTKPGIGEMNLSPGLLPHRCMTALCGRYFLLDCNGPVTEVLSLNRQ